MATREPPSRRPETTPKARPDPGPMRFLIGFTGLVAATAIATALVRAQPAHAMVAAEAAADPIPTQPPPLVVRHVTTYVQLQPGQSAPPGAKVVAQPDPSPRVVVVTITPPPRAAAPRRVVVVTRQSGTK